MIGFLVLSDNTLSLAPLHHPPPFPPFMNQKIRGINPTGTI